MTEGLSAAQLEAINAVFEPFNRSDQPGLVVGVALNGWPIYRRGFGLASVEYGVANTPATRMRIGSTCKQMTCLAVMLLAESGQLDIDAPARSILPEIPGFEVDPTLRQLMTHTGGYRCYIANTVLSDGSAIRPKGTLLPSLLRQAATNFPPGERWLYSNSGFHLVSLAVERVSGMPFATFLKQRIFEPLRMIDTELVRSDLDITTRMATLHVGLPGGTYRRGLFFGEELLGEGGIVSTVDDMLRWLAHFREPKLLGSGSTWEQMIRPTRLGGGATSVPYGLGVICTTYKGFDVFQHAGGVVGGSCQAMTVPELALDIVVMTNGAPVSPALLANQVVDVFAGDRQVPAVERVPTAGMTALVDRRYTSASGMVYGFGDAGGSLGLSIVGLPPVPLRRVDDEMHLAFEEAGIGPIVVRGVPDGATHEAPASLEIVEGAGVESFRRLPEIVPALDERDDLVGSYYCHDLDASARFVREEEGLRLRVSSPHGAVTMALQAYDSDVYGCMVRDPVLPQFVVLKVEANERHVTALRLNARHARNLVFRRVMPDGARMQCGADANRRTTQ